MKIGIDLHGVLDTKPLFFRRLMAAVVIANGEVHVVTGMHTGEAFEKQMAALKIRKGVHYTHVFSIADHHRSQGTTIVYDESGNPHLDPYFWDKSKADYCFREQIDLHLDDSDIYHTFFLTPYARFYSKDGARQKKIRL